MLVNCLAWRNKFVMNSVLLMFGLTCLREDGAFPLRGLLVGFWFRTVKPGFISCYDPGEEVLIVLTSSNSSGRKMYATTSHSITSSFSTSDSLP
jgi:hypothetical protein